MNNQMTSKTIKQIFTNPDHVCDYENKTRRSNWLGPEIMFGLSYRYVQAGDKLLDLGIGTGLCSEMFYKAGLMVYGIDFSPDMLKVCHNKNITVELKEHDLCITPYPYATNSMDHVVCGGVMHILSDIAPLFSEASRIIRPGGTFVFCDHVDTRNVDIRLHSNGIINQLKKHHFEQIKSLTYEVSIYNKFKRFNVYSVRSIK